MNPLLFGSRARQLFGLHLPAAGRRQRRGAVLCSPWGQEYLRSHRSLKLLGDRLAQTGHDVLRFDYYGSGDSAGAEEEFSLEGCVDDAEAAVREVQDLARVRRVTLVGLRLGAAVAAAAAGRLRGVDRLVLWDPVTDGASYVDGLRWQSPGKDDIVDGYPLTPSLASEMEAVDQETFAASPDEVLLIVSEERDEHETLKRSLSGGERSVDFELRPNPRCWVEEADFGAGAVPVDVLQAIAGWRS